MCLCGHSEKNHTENGCFFIVKEDKKYVFCSCMKLRKVYILQ